MARTSVSPRLYGKCSAVWLLVAGATFSNLAAPFLLVMLSAARHLHEAVCPGSTRRPRGGCVQGLRCADCAQNGIQALMPKAIWRARSIEGSRLIG